MNSSVGRFRTSTANNRDSASQQQWNSHYGIDLLSSTSKQKICIVPYTSIHIYVATKALLYCFTTFNVYRCLAMDKLSPQILWLYFHWIFVTFHPLSTFFLHFSCLSLSLSILYMEYKLHFFGGDNTLIFRIFVSDTFTYRKIEIYTESFDFAFFSFVLLIWVGCAIIWIGCCIFLLKLTYSIDSIWLWTERNSTITWRTMKQKQHCVCVMVGLRANTITATWTRYAFNVNVACMYV